MDWIVTTATTVDEAQSRALDLLGVDSADAEVQVLEEGKTGLFGRVKSEARVRARIKPKAPPAKDERRGGNSNRGRGGDSRDGRGGNNRGGNNRGGNSSQGKQSQSGGSSSGGRDRTKQKASNQSGKQNNRNDAGSSKSNNDSNRGGRDDNTSGRSGSGRNGGGRSGGGRSGAPVAAAAAASGGRSGGRGRGNDRNDRPDREDRVEMPVDEQRSTLEAFVTGVAKSFDTAAKVTLVEEETTLTAKVNGGDLGRLIGKKAATLQAFEELARTAMHRAADGRRYHRIQVDVDDHRVRRREALARFATETAQRVADSGESVAMEPMGAADRKLIHDAVGEVAGVETMSEGRDPRRYIVILPLGTDEEE